jgi:subtilase family serine protease
MTPFVNNCLHFPLRIATRRLHRSARRLPLQLACCAALALSAAIPALAQVSGGTKPSTVLVRPRIQSVIENSSRVALVGSRSPRALPANDIGAVPASMKLQGITLVFSRTAAQQTALDALVAAQQDPASPQFHQWITPEQYAAQFGVAASDIAAVQSWLQQQGFTPGAVSRSRDRISFSGTAAQVEAAFGTPLHYFRGPARSGDITPPQTHFAPAADLTLPAALAGSVLAVENLSDFRPHSNVKLAHQPARSNFTSSQTGSHFITANDLATIYDIRAAYNAGYNGTGQSIAVVGQTEIVSADISSYQTAIGSSAKVPAQILVPLSGAATIYTGDEIESDLDLEYSSTVAPGANVYFVYTGNSKNYSVYDAIAYAVDNMVAPVITTSYGDCEIDLGMTNYNSLNAVLEQAAAQGQTVVGPAGDNGSTDCYGVTSQTTAVKESLAVDFPASSQYVTGMGGTEFPAADVTASTGNTQYFAGSPGSDVVSSALSYIPEEAWNDDSSADSATPLSSGGGGVSIYTQRPTWQTGVPGIPAGSMRLVPDISFDASNADAPYAVCSSDQTNWATGQTSSCTSGLRDSNSQDLTLAGGTSFDAPIFAAMVAILNQAKGFTTGQGVINPILYNLASSPTTYALDFHDITNGGNQCTAGTAFCSTAGAASYATTTGYDEATGLGSLDFYNILNAWPGTVRAANTSFAVTAATATVAPGSSATSTVTVTPANGYTGTVNFTVTSNTPALTYACWSLPSATVTGTTAATSTLTIATTNSTLSSSQFTCPSGSAVLLARPAMGGGIAANNVPPASTPIRTPVRTPAAPLAAVMAGVLLAGFTLKRRTRLSLESLARSGRSLALFAVLGMAFSALSFGLLGLAGCSSSASGLNKITPTSPTTPTTGVSATPAGTYTITVTGISSTNSNLVSTSTFTLTVS